MYRSLMISALIILSLNTYCQESKRFEYRHIKNSLYTSSSYLVSPKFDQTKIEGNVGIPRFLDQSYIDDLFNNVFNRSISKFKRDSVSPRTIARFAINQKGEVFYCQFILNFSDTLIITDEDFYTIYIKLIETKVDMTKVRIESDYDYGPKQADYTILMCRLISKDSWERFSKNLEEKRKAKRLQDPTLCDSIIIH